VTAGTNPYVDVLVEEHDELPEGCELRFHAVGPTRPVRRVLYEPLEGLHGQGQGEGEFEVRAANGDGTESEARAVPVDDSGAGTSVLVYGGVRGLRLYRSGGAGDRGANGAAPVAEPYLLLADDSIIG
jgi:hypothetical protein